MTVADTGHEDDTLDLTEDMEAGEEAEQPEQQEEAEEYTLEIEGEDADEDDADIPDEPEPSKQLRAKLRDKIKTEQREKFELQKRLTALEQANAPAPIVVGDEPLWGEFGEDWEWDGQKFAEAHAAWADRKAKADATQADAKRTRDAEQAEYQKDLNNYVAKKAALPVSQDKKDAAEQLLINTLPQVLQTALVKYTDDPAKVAFALASSPAKLAALAQEKDPIRFIIAVREMEGKIKMVTKKKPNPPESGTISRGSAPVAPGNASKTLAKLEDEARRTGDRTKLIDYKRDQKAKAA